MQFHWNSSEFLNKTCALHGAMLIVGTLQNNSTMFAVLHQLARTRMHAAQHQSKQKPPSYTAGSAASQFTRPLNPAAAAHRSTAATLLSFLL
jgi:hypothetical protein